MSTNPNPSLWLTLLTAPARLRVIMSHYRVDLRVAMRPLAMSTIGHGEALLAPGHPRFIPRGSAIAATPCTVHGTVELDHFSIWTKMQAEETETYADCRPDLSASGESADLGQGEGSS